MESKYIGARSDKKNHLLLLVVELDSVLPFTKKEYFSVEYAALFCLMLTNLPQL